MVLRLRHNIPSIFGGTERVNYYASVGYQAQQSFLQTDDMNYDKWTMRSNLSANITKNLKLDVNLSGLMDERNTPHYGAYDIIRGLWLMQPMDPIYRGEWRFYPAFKLYFDESGGDDG